MHTVTTLDIFKKEVVKMARQKNATLFHCYIQGDIFKIATAKKVQQFDFSKMKSDKKVCHFIDEAIQILRKHLLEQLLLFSETNFKRNSVPENRNLVLLLFYCIRFAPF